MRKLIQRFSSVAMARGKKTLARISVMREVPMSAMGLGVGLEWMV